MRYFSIQLLNAAASTGILVVLCQAQKAVPLPLIPSQRHRLMQENVSTCVAEEGDFESCLAAFSFKSKQCKECASAAFPLAPPENVTRVYCSSLRAGFCNATASCSCLQYCHQPFLRWAECQLLTPPWLDLVKSNCSLDRLNATTNCSALDNLPNTSSAPSTIGDSTFGWIAGRVIAASTSVIVMMTLFESW
jgi:hypothetical protein